MCEMSIGEVLGLIALALICSIPFGILINLDKIERVWKEIRKGCRR